MWEQGLLTAAQAAEVGFVSEVWPVAELAERALAKAARIAELDPMSPR